MRTSPSKLSIRLFYALSMLLALVSWTSSVTFAEGTTPSQARSRLSSETPLMGPLTVETDIAILDGFEASGLGGSALWLAGLTVTPDDTVPALAVSVREVSHWFGRAYTVYLESDRSSLQYGPNGSPSGLTQYTLGSLAFESGQRYRTRLAYEPLTGDVSIVIKNVTTGKIELSQYLAWDATTHELYLASGAHTKPQSGSEAVSLERMEVIGAYLPAPGHWSIRQRQGSSDEYLPVDRIDRRQELAVFTNMPHTTLPGTLQVSLFPIESVEGAKPVARWDATPSGLSPIADLGLPAGQYRAILEYVIEDRAWTLDETIVTVGSVAAEFIDVEGMLGNGGIHVQGTLLLQSDGPVPGVHLALSGHLFAHTAQFDTATRHVTTERTSLETTAPARIDSLYIGDLDGTVAINFDLEIPLGELPSDVRMWEVHLGPVVAPAFYSNASSPHVTWIGPEIREGSWVGFLHNDQTRSYELQPGVVVHRIRGRLPAGPIAMFILEADLTEADITVDTMVGAQAGPHSAVWPRSPISSMAKEHGALAAINADFFHIHDTMAPRGLHIQSGTLLTTGTDHRATLGITDSGTVHIGYWLGWGRLTGKRVSQPVVVSGANVDRVLNDRVYVYRWPWHRSPGIDAAYVDHDGAVVELVVGDVAERECPADSITPPDAVHCSILTGVVEEIRHDQAGVAIPEGAVVVTGFGKAAHLLAEAFSVGDEIEFEHGVAGPSEWPGLAEDERLKAAVGGGVVLVRNGQFGDEAVFEDLERHPRTAVGISQDQQRMIWLVVDGRSSTSVGMTYREMADLFLYMGAFHAINLDGGGSSTLVGRDPQTGAMLLFNVPSDGSERPVPNGLGIFTE